MLSLWLEPEKANFTTLLDKNVDPHVTLLSPIQFNQTVAIEQAELLADEAHAFDITFDQMDYEEVWTRAGYLKAVPNVALSILHDLAARMLVVDGSGYMPHLSLIYSTAPESERRAQVESLNYELPVTRTFNRLSLYSTPINPDKPDFSEWKRVWTRELRKL